jgi:deazaflavin-dependent oxidoreductase (nitroreductase family)
VRGRRPAWYYNVVAHPERVSVEYGGRTRPVTVVQLAGDERTEAWKHIVAQSPQFGGYESKTDRELPVLASSRLRSLWGRRDRTSTTKTEPAQY